MNVDLPTSRQAELVDHAVELLRESGLAGLTVRRLAERVGFTEAALYRHFPSKRALLLAVVDRTRERFLGPVRAIAARPSPAEDRLRAILLHHVRLILATDGMPMLFLAEATAGGDAELLERLSQTVGAYTQALSGLLAELPESPERPAPDDLALVFLGLPAAAAVRLRLTGERPADLEALAAFLVRRLLTP